MTPIKDDFTRNIIIQFPTEIVLHVVIYIFVMLVHLKDMLLLPLAIGSSVWIYILKNTFFVLGALSKGKLDGNQLYYYFYYNFLFFSFFLEGIGVGKQIFL